MDRRDDGAGAGRVIRVRILGTPDGWNGPQIFDADTGVDISRVVPARYVAAARAAKVGDRLEWSLFVRDERGIVRDQGINGPKLDPVIVEVMEHV
jgi:hypothetical protein